MVLVPVGSGPKWCWFPLVPWCQWCQLLGMAGGSFCLEPEPWVFLRLQKWFPNGSMVPHGSGSMWVFLPPKLLDVGSFCHGTMVLCEKSLVAGGSFGYFDGANMVLLWCHMVPAVGHNVVLLVVPGGS